ncbi:MAG: methyltransferase [Spirochaetaceae bacterium]|jgi:23S rRNA (uracil1939-C5)-methyltransferase|nr:methyltransferase [Spirochaetaceae bacterium]
MNGQDDNENCPYSGRCGGCPLIGIDYGEQLLQKTEALRQAFIRAGSSPPPDIKAIPSRPFGYRNRIQLHRIPVDTPPDTQAYLSGKLKRGGRSRPLRLERPRESAVGFMSRSGRNGSAASEIVPVDDCPVASPSIRRALRTGGIVPPVDRDRFCVYGGDSVLLVEGVNSRGTARIRSKDITLDAGVFFQSNGALLELLIDEALAAAESARGDLPAADFYCGVGTFSVFLQERFERMDLLETNRDALRLARENVKANGARFFGQSDTVWAQNTGKSLALPYGFAVADPGRRGLSAAMARFLGSACKILCYVSCNPAALARDAAIITSPECGSRKDGGGLRLESLSFYDFYPQTRHIESLTVFRQR